MKSLRVRLVLPTLIVAAVCTSPLVAQAESRRAVEAELDRLLEARSNGGGRAAFMLPDADDLANIPQDSANPLTPEKVALGRLLFHETAVGTATAAPDRQQSYGCASCHHVAAGFKSGIPQGISDGGRGFGRRGEGRRVAFGLDATLEDGDPGKPDVQPIATPTVLNAAYQDVMLWNGALGSRFDGLNAGIRRTPEFGPDGFNVNRFGLSGLETQVLAGTKVHRLDFDPGSILQSDSIYRALYDAAYPDGDTGFGVPDFPTQVSPEALGAAKAIAAYERTLLANRAPFQRWLRGDSRAMNARELRGARVFFGNGGCADCHTGPALSSWPGAAEGAMFFAVGFADLDVADSRVHGVIDQETVHGRGGFTENSADRYRFKVPPLYNLRDSDVLGHGASFASVREVIEYKNAGVPEHPAFVTDPDAMANLALGFVPLGLSRRDVSDLTGFVERALHDPELSRYVPDALPSGNCFPVADFAAALDLRCF